MNGRQAGKFERLPRCVVVMAGVLVCVRFLRTQQRAKNRCQVLSRFVVVAPFLGLLSWAGFISLVDLELSQFDSFCSAGIYPSGFVFPFTFGCWVLNINGEFDPGSGRTLAACLTHASRTVSPACGVISGERESNT